MCDCLAVSIGSIVMSVSVCLSILYVCNNNRVRLSLITLCVSLTVCVYIVSQKKLCHYTFVYNFDKC